MENGPQRLSLSYSNVSVCLIFEQVSQSFGAEWAISLALEPEANHLVTGAVDAATGELMAAQIVSGQGLEVR